MKPTNGTAATAVADPDTRARRQPPITGTPPTVRDVVRWLKALIDPDQVVELRVPKVHIELFDAGRLAELAGVALKYSGQVPGVYFTLNPMAPHLAGGRRSAKDADITRRRRLLIDCDPQRPPDTSATDAEKAEALATASAIRDFLTSLEFPAPIEGDSGNGGHLVYAIDLPNDDASRDLIRAVLRALAARFNSPAVAIDTSVYNASRICKLYGTEARKGTPTAERPHRFSRVLKVPKSFTEVPRERLEGLAATPSPTTSTRPRAGGLAKPADGTTISPSAILVRARNYLGGCPSAVSGRGGHTQTLKAAGIGPGFDLPPDDAFALMRDEYNPRCEPPWTEAELRHKVDEAYKNAEGRGFLLKASRSRSNGLAHLPGDGDGRGPTRTGDDGPAGTDRRDVGMPYVEDRNDLGNCRRLARLHGEDLHFVMAYGKWMVWDGARWKEDDADMIHSKAKGIVPAIRAEAKGYGPDRADQKEAHLKWAVSSGNRSRIEGAIFLARSEPGIPAVPTQLDSDPWAFNCKNGTLDLKSGRFRPHRREDLITRLAPVAFDPGARCPKFDRFIDEITCFNIELSSYLRRCVGYSLTGVIREHRLFFLYGTGRNGKSTFLKATLNLWGDYGTLINAGLLTSKNQEDHPTGLTDLEGRRFVSTIEVEDGKRMAEALVKTLTGGDPIKARRLYENFYMFNPSHHIFLAANHRPEIRGTDVAIWNRISLIPFDAVFTKEAGKPPIADLDEQLAAEAAGILNWAIRGCREWLERGLDEPEAVRAAVEGYRDEMDLLGAFIEERCDIGPTPPTTPPKKVAFPDLYGDYVAWCKANNTPPLGYRRFGNELSNRGHTSEKTNGANFRLGLDLKPPKF
ncbi:MAG: phage/plasmid primase, P4 family [Singulisphaera sp.]